MDFITFKKLVEKTRKEHPAWFGIESDACPTDNDLIEAERKLNTTLHSDYKRFILEYGGGYFAFSNVYSLEVGSDWNIVDINYKYAGICDKYVLISENGAGDFYGFKVVEGVCEPKIYFYDHERETWQESPYHNLFDYLEKTALTN